VLVLELADVVLHGADAVLDATDVAAGDPERKARQTGLASQLEDAIGKLESELAAAQASGDARRIKEAQESLDARRIWLDALGG
jgi:hypothetical protein